MILWFSGNGNSRLAAERLGKLTGDSIVELTVARSDMFTAECKRIVWVFPIYSWGVPPIVLAFMRHLDFPAGVCHHMVCTCGDDIGYADRQWRAELGKRGAKCISAFSVTMPNTYVLLPGMDTDSRDVAGGKLAAAADRLKDIAAYIAGGTEEPVTDVVRGVCPWIKSRVIYPFFVKHMMSPKPFHPEDSCILCGRCVSVCPMNNIRLDDRGRPVWGDRCALCLGCYNVCPTHAVAYGRRTVGKHQYHAPESFGADD